VATDPSLVQAIMQTADEVLKQLSEKSSDKDVQYYEDGIWHSNFLDKGGWLYQAGPAGLAAALWKYRQGHLDQLDPATREHQAWLRDVCLRTFDRALREHQLPNGDLSDCEGHRDFFTIDMLCAYLTFKDTMDAEMRQRWLAATKLQVDFMIARGDLPNSRLPGWKATDGWYVNGNVELCEAAWIYLVWQATGEARYEDLYEVQLKHTLRPSQERWKGYGLYYMKEGIAADGSDSSGFICEAEQTPGFDYEYGMLQVSTAARLYTRTQDPRLLRLSNVLLNALLPRVDQQTMILDATYGSRHSVITNFSSCAPAIVVWLGGRADLAPMLEGQFKKGIKPILAEYAINGGAPGIYRSYGFDLAALIEAITIAEAKR
jgi:hypothetical protein